MNFARTAFAQFLAGGVGRVIRILVGTAILASGALLIETAWGIPILVFGAIPIAAGLFDFCVLTGIFGGPLSGEQVRALRPSLRSRGF